MVVTVRDLALASRLSGVKPSVLLERLLGALEDDARVNVEGAA